MPIKLIILIFAVMFTWEIAFGQEWQAFSFQKAGFQMKFPNKPVEDAADNSLVLSTEDEGITFQVVAYWSKNYNINNADALLEESIKGFVNPKTDKIDKKTTSKILGYTSKDVWISASNGEKIVFRTLITPNKLFQFVITRKQKPVDEVVVKKFLNSFALLGK